MLPELANIIGGTKVLAGTRASRATGQASSPEPSTTTAAASASAPYRARLKSLAESTPKINAGNSTVMLSWLAAPMSGRRQRL